ncbi:hypothetical protein GYMLUDRAFT_1028696, partial [Collybiopsis luxurians FD-317 M1]
VVGAMHGYVHDQVCQLLFLMLYSVGVRLEDGEGYEWYFNVSNALAPATHYQSAFHCRQSISEFIYYKDLEMYSNISKFVYGNYTQALSIIRTKDVHCKGMLEAGINSPDVFYKWLIEEGKYLRSLTQTLPKESLEMLYYQKLVALQKCQEQLQNAHQSKHQHEQENELKLLADVQALEEKLGISKRWVDGCEEWELAKRSVREANYCRALDKLKWWLVAKMFEMARLNIAGTGMCILMSPFIACF